MHLWILVVLLLSVQSEALVGGGPLKDHRDIVRLIFTNGWICTGVFLDEYTILTAAHCLNAAPLAQVLSEEDSVVEVKAIATFAHPDFAKNAASDIGIIKTERNRTFQGNFSIHEQPLSLSREVTLFGCGKAGIDGQVVRTTGSNRFIRFGSMLYFLGLTNGDTASIAPNDSGGPIVDPGTKRIIGIASKTTLKTSEKYGLPILSTGVSIVAPASMKFIRSHLGNNP